MGKPETYNPTDEERDRLRKQAWQLWCRGVRNVSEISRTIGVHRKTTKKYIDHQREQTKERIETGDEIAEILSGYQETISAAWAIYAGADNDNAKVGALGKVQEGLKAIAGMFDISTEKSKQDVNHSGNIDTSSGHLGEVLRILVESGAVEAGAEGAPDAAAE